MPNIKEIADEADLIVNGYAFKRCEVFCKREWRFFFAEAWSIK